MTEEVRPSSEPTPPPAPSGPEAAPPRRSRRWPILLAALAGVVFLFVFFVASVELLDYQKLSSTSGRGVLPAGRFATDERENLVLTGPTRALRTWLAGHQSRPDLFAAPVVLTRKPLPSAPMTASPPAPTAPPASGRRSF